MRLAGLIAVLFLSAVVWAQTPNATSVEGVVTNAVTGEPVRFAHLSLMGDERFGAITTVQGKFSISGLTPRLTGGYSVTLEHSGYLPLEVGNLKLKTGEANSGIELKMMPEAVISGRVVDDAGNPMEGITVTAIRGVRDWENATDDRGGFRIGGLPSGKYLLRTRPERGVGRPPEIRSDGTRETYFGPTYYPSTVDGTLASPVEAHAGAELGGIEIRMVSQPIVGVSGRVTVAPGEPQNSLVLCGVDGMARTRADGTFTIWRLPSGKCRLTAQFGVPPEGPWMSAPLEITVGQENLTGIELPMLKPFDIAGRIEGWSGTKGWLHLTPEQPGITSGAQAAIDEKGGFRAEHLGPDRYRITISGIAEDSYMERLRLGSVEMTDGILDLRKGKSGEALEVRIGTNGARISGMVKDAKGPVANARVVLRVGGAWQTAHTGDDGAYVFHGIAPGKYHLFTLQDWEPESLVPSDTETVEVSEGDRVVKDLKVAGGG